MTLADQLWAARRRWWIIVLCVLAGGALAGYYGSKQPRHYSATATAYAAAVGGSEITTEQVGSYAVVASSIPVMRRVQAQLGLKVSPQRLSREIKATVSAGTALLTITVTDSSAARAAAVANATVKALARAVRGIDSSSRIRTVQTASTPTSPQASKEDLDGGVGIVVGLLVGCILVLTIRLPRLRRRTVVSRSAGSPGADIPTPQETVAGTLDTGEDAESSSGAAPESETSDAQPRVKAPTEEPEPVADETAEEPEPEPVAEATIEEPEPVAEATIEEPEPVAEATIEEPEPDSVAPDDPPEAQTLTDDTNADSQGSQGQSAEKGAAAKPTRRQPPEEVPMWYR
jgi:hypothetical protein